MAATDLGAIIAGKPSKLKICAKTIEGKDLFIRLRRYKDAGELPQGLEIKQDGSIIGRTDFKNRTTFDKGTTTFSVTDSKLETVTTWDSKFTFWVEAFDLMGSLNGITVVDGGSGYTSAPTVTITGGGGIQATATCTINGSGEVDSVTIVDGGSGFTHQPTITFTGGGGSGTLATATIPGGFGASEHRQFSVTVNSYAYKPWEDLYCIALPHLKDRANWEDFTSDFNIFDSESLYRKNDERFGLQRDIRILVKSGLNPKYLKDYLTQMEEYHYTKTLRFGDLKSARSYVNGKVEYEVIYYEIQELSASEEELINLSETDYDFPPIYASTNKVKASLLDGPGVPDYSADMTTWSPAYDIYPNSFFNMRRRLKDEIGEVVSEAKSLPTWMSTEQNNGDILQYKTVAPIAYVLPGEAERIKFLIKRSNFNPNNFLFQVDRYEWDRDMSDSYDVDIDQYADKVYVTLDSSTTTFDETDMKFMDVVQIITGDGSNNTFNLEHYVNRSSELAISTPAFSGLIQNATQANPVIITTTQEHNLQSGLKIKITNMGGYDSSRYDSLPYDLESMVELNDREFYINVISTTEFELYLDSSLSTSEDGTGHTAYTTGGIYVGTDLLLTPVKDYVSQFKEITFTAPPLNNVEYTVVFKEYAPQTYHKVSEKDKYIKFPKTGVYE